MERGVIAFASHYRPHLLLDLFEEDRILHYPGTGRVKEGPKFNFTGEL